MREGDMCGCVSTCVCASVWMCKCIHVCVHTKYSVEVMFMFSPTIEGLGVRGKTPSPPSSPTSHADDITHYS